MKVKQPLNGVVTRNPHWTQWITLSLVDSRQTQRGWWA